MQPLGHAADERVAFRLGEKIGSKGRALTYSQQISSELGGPNGHHESSVVSHRIEMGAA